MKLFPCAWRKLARRSSAAVVYAGKVILLGAAVLGFLAMFFVMGGGQP